MNPRHMVHYPPAMGLHPRPADSMDYLCRDYYVAVCNSNYPAVARMEARVREVFGPRASDRDEAFSAGQVLASCRFVPC